MKRIEVAEVSAGDLCAIVGLESVDIGDTIADPEDPKAFPPVTIDEPTMTMLFRINDSPSQAEGKYVTSRQIRDRLYLELEERRPPRQDRQNPLTSSSSRAAASCTWGILLETMRREGAELSIGKPEVIIRKSMASSASPLRRC